MQPFIHASLYRSDQHMTAGFSARPTHGGHHVDVIIKDLTVAGCRMLCPVELDERQEWMIDLPAIGMRPCLISRSRRHGIRCEFQTALDFPQIEKARAAHVAAGAALLMRRALAGRGIVSAQDRRLSRLQRLLLITLAAIGAWLSCYAAVRLGAALLGSGF